MAAVNICTAMVATGTTPWFRLQGRPATFLFTITATVSAQMQVANCPGMPGASDLVNTGSAVSATGVATLSYPSYEWVRLSATITGGSLTCAMCVSEV